MKRTREETNSEIEFLEQSKCSERESFRRIAAGSSGYGLVVARENHEARMKTLDDKIRQLQDELMDEDPNIRQSRENAAQIIVGIWGDYTFERDGSCSIESKMRDFDVIYSGTYTVDENGSGDITAHFGKGKGGGMEFNAIGRRDFNLQGDVLMLDNEPGHPRIELRRNVAAERRRAKQIRLREERDAEIKRKKDEHNASMDEITSAAPDAETVRRLQPLRERAARYNGTVTAGARLANGRVRWVVEIPKPHYNKNTWKGKTKKWRNITALSEDTKNIIGLKSNGRVVIAGDAVYFPAYRKAIKKFKNIIAISVCHDKGFEGYILGLKSDGTVVSANIEPALKSWGNITAIAVGRGFYVGLKKDGTVVAVNGRYSGNGDAAPYINTKSWRDIVAIAAGPGCTVGLKADGRVVTAGINSHGRCNTQNWHDIIDIAVGENCTIGLKADGTIVTAGQAEADSENQENIVAIFDGGFGLKADGTVVGPM